MPNISAFIDNFSKELNKQCFAFDSTWMIRKRVFNSMTLFISIFFMTMERSSNFKSVADLIRLNAFPSSVDFPRFAASSFCEARKKFSPYLFVDISQWVYRFVRDNIEKKEWFARPIFIIDSTVITLPKALEKEGFGYEDRDDFYPSALLTTIYDPRLGLTYDTVLSQHRSERMNAYALMKGIPEGGLLIGDRGFFSFEMLYEARLNKIDVLLRIAFEHAPVEIQELRHENFKEATVTINPFVTLERTLLRRGYPPEPIEVRVFRKSIKGNDYLLITTVLDTEIKHKDFFKLYESRWDVEESYKLLKAELEMQSFKSKHINGILQEIYSTLLLANISQAVTSLQLGPKTKTAVRTVTSVLTVTRVVRNAFFSMISHLKSIRTKAAILIANAVENAGSKHRPGRSYPRNFFSEPNPWSRYAKGIRR